MRAAILQALAEPTQVEITSDIPRFSLWGAEYGPYTRGAHVDVPRMVALGLVSAGVAQLIEESLELEVYKLLSREKSSAHHGAAQLSRLPPGFYQHLFFAIQAAEKAGLKERKERLDSVLQDLITMRLSKIVRTLSYSSVPSSMPGISEEEQLLLEALSRIVGGWRSSLRGVWLWR